MWRKKYPSKEEFHQEEEILRLPDFHIVSIICGNRGGLGRALGSLTCAVIIHQ